jgi:hypothetical protein
MNRRLTSGLLFTVVASVTLASAGGLARADVAFRKKKAPTTESSATEASPTGGEVDKSTAPPPAGTEAAPAAAAQTQYVPQADDTDRPHDPSLLTKTPADAAVDKQARQRDEGPPFYTKWQFWTVTGLIVVGAVAAVWAGTKLAHEAGGGDIRTCDTMRFVGCFGQGR